MLVLDRVLRRCRDYLNQRAYQERRGRYVGGVWEMTGPLSFGLGRGGNSLSATRGGNGGDVVIRVRPGCAIHFDDATIFPSDYGHPAEDGTPGVHPGRLVFVWDDEEV